MELTGSQGLISYLKLLLYDPLNPLLFNSGLFLFLFVAFLGVYTFIEKHKTYRVVYVILFSLFFYYKSSGIFFLLLLVSTGIDYALGWKIHLSKNAAERKLFLILSIVANLGLLAYFKYANFIIDIINDLGSGGIDPVSIFLPVGISFFTFQTMSYTIDIYRGKLQPEANVLDFCFFVSFFPQLVAGPIVRAVDFLPQIRQNIHVSHEAFGRGFLLICGGLFKKAVISDYIGANFVDRIFDNPSLYSGFENLMGVYGYALQIYCDFSGYSDIAIGIGLLMGFTLPINFNSPYQSKSLQEFWRRWHISLSTWLRDYLYISLGGNRRGRIRTYINLMVTMVLGGLWHGASWQFVIWGTLHGAMLATERFILNFRAFLRQGVPKLDVYVQENYITSENKFLKKAGQIYAKAGGRYWKTRMGLEPFFAKTRKPFYYLMTFHFVCFCWVFFRAESMDLAREMLTQVTTAFNYGIIPEALSVYYKVFLVMLLGFVMHILPTSFDQLVEKRFIASPVIAKSFALAVIIWLSIQMYSTDIQPFIYFQF